MSDPLSDVLALMEMESVATARLETGGAWALRFPAKTRIKFNAVLSGQCWIAVEGQPACRLDAGDTFLLCNAPAFVLSDTPWRPGAPVVDGAPLFAAALRAQGNRVRHGGATTVLLGGGFRFSPNNAALLLDVLPRFLHIPGTHEAATVLRSTLALLDAELAAGAMGASLVARRLADILLVQALRAHVALGEGAATGWMAALADAKIGAALKRLHQDPRHNWTVAALGHVAGMSRSGFALRFRQLVGMAPLAYLTHWRMELACSQLRRADTPVAVLASQLGYASESAFGNAFKRHFGRAPKRYWRHGEALPVQED